MRCAATPANTPDDRYFSNSKSTVLPTSPRISNHRSVQTRTTKFPYRLSVAVFQTQIVQYLVAILSYFVIQPRALLKNYPYTTNIDFRPVYLNKRSFAIDISCPTLIFLQNVNAVINPLQFTRHYWLMQLHVIIYIVTMVTAYVVQCLHGQCCRPWTCYVSLITDRLIKYNISRYANELLYLIYASIN
jgi:hypothetical protein